MIRITAGLYKGRAVRTPKNEKTRPTSAKLRQALMNSIQVDLPDARVLDLFAGSGVLGFEALSRGAQGVVFVESARPVAQLIQTNAKDLSVSEKVRVVQGEVQNSWERVLGHGPFDLIFADPPYFQGHEEKLLRLAPWDRLLNPGGLLSIEWGRERKQTSEGFPDQVGPLSKLREKEYGDSCLTLYRMGEPDGS